MKKTFLLLAALCLAIEGNAQTKTYSSNDSNLDGMVNISDVNSVISEMCGESNSVRVISVDSVCAVARSIDSDFGIQLEKALAVEKTVNVSSITLSSTSASIFAGNKEYIAAAISPEDATDKTVTWISSNTSVATVADGIVTATAAGTTIITAIANDGSGVSATCALTVGDDPSDQYEYVDLGLSVKWAKMNVGATNIYDKGDYFAWGETSGYKSGKSYFYPETYRYYEERKEANKDIYHRGYTKYVKISDQEGYDGTFYDDKTTLESFDDAATVNMGSKWRMPTQAEWLELESSCTWEWMILNDVEVYKLTAANGNYIFLPLAGYRYNSDYDLTVSYGTYWSSSLCSFRSDLACCMDFNNYNVHSVKELSRFVGYSVRAVRSK